MKKRIFQALGLLLTAVAIGYFTFVTVRNAASLPTIEWDSRTYFTVVEAVVLYVCIVAIGGCAWFMLLRGVKQFTQPGTALVIFGLANIAKYIPGNVGQLVGRVALARKRGLHTPNVVSSLVFEAAWDILSASVTAIVILLIVGRAYFDQTQQLPETWQLGLAAAIAALAPFAGLWAIKRWRFGPLRALLDSNSLEFPGGGTFFACFLLYVATFLIMGLIANLLAQGLFHVPGASFWVVTGSVTIAWVAGFVTPGSPAGAGVREAILVATLSPIYTPGVAVGVSIALRVVTSLGDGAAFVIAAAARQFTNRTSAKTLRT